MADVKTLREIADQCEDAIRFGQVLADLRNSSGMTLREVSDRSGVASSHIWALENGKGRDVTLRMMRTMANCYGVPVSRFLTPADLADPLHPEAMRIAIQIDEAFRRALAASQEQCRDE